MADQTVTVTITVGNNITQNESSVIASRIAEAVARIMRVAGGALLVWPPSRYHSGRRLFSLGIQTKGGRLLCSAS